MFVPPSYSETEARAAVAASLSYAETLRLLGMCPTGGGRAVLKKYLTIWGIATDHFDPNAVRDAALRNRTITPLGDLLVRGGTARSSKLKERLYREGLKERRCELCGQDEQWRGRRMSLILDHENGDSTDNRLENLRVVCPNCNATLDTHCGRNPRLHGRLCTRCGETYSASHRGQRFCSRTCAQRHLRAGRPNLSTRKVVERPPYGHLVAEVDALGWEETGRRYGVSRNAVRKWVRTYEDQRAA